jgi:hypothetical protein
VARSRWPVHYARDARSGTNRRVPLIRLAEVFNVSIDHLLIDALPRRAPHAPENALGDRLAIVAELSDDELGANGVH